ncbi:low temperature requirement protein A [Bacillus sp. AFS015802]|uniref:low temperature requirement protein A n=1 Tax=Bacillus sp. AFS015802 TaxID=2033486 RepID=UPI000BF70C25|nr:low temperature requirement protein A [Bacillus sp. AFS015802]PFA63007.1 low temperature requirement protein A [Bacillus sp. AFS015802]
MPHKKVNWIELFNDLIFVAAIATVTHTLVHVEDGHIHPEYFMKFILIFIPIWWAWVGQTLYINRYGEDSVKDRIWMTVQMMFVILMTASLSVDFDAYFLPFLIGYLGIRFVTAIQYLMTARMEAGNRKALARYLGFGFLIGGMISLGSILFDGWFRYFVLYMGIAIDILIPIIGRKHLKRVPIHTPHLLERFGLLTIILFGEFIVSIVAIVNGAGDLGKGLFVLFISFTLVMAMWWQYFENMEKKIDKESKTSGQLIIYGHLVIFMSMSVIAAMIQVGFLYSLNKELFVSLTFGATFLYFIGTTSVFHKYRHPQTRLGMKHFITLLSLIALLWSGSFFLPVEETVVFIELACFFIVYAFVTVK